jgi:hypothetical protein
MTMSFKISDALWRLRHLFGFTKMSKWQRRMWEQMGRNKNLVIAPRFPRVTRPNPAHQPSVEVVVSGREDYCCECGGVHGYVCPKIGK